jgi:hypothetical protein
VAPVPCAGEVTHSRAQAARHGLRRRRCRHWRRRRWRRAGPRDEGRCWHGPAGPCSPACWPRLRVMMGQEPRMQHVTWPGTNRQAAGPWMVSVWDVCCDYYFLFPQKKKMHARFERENS